MNIVTRFAPSPTGYLHVGNVRTALVNWLFSRKSGGKFILRIDDTDKLRSKDEYTKQIIEDLKWLGLNFDLEFSQSSREKRYNEVRDHLINIGKLYPCFESQEELDVKRKILLGMGKPPIYDRASLKLSEEDIRNKINEGKKPHYRFMLDDGEINWEDYIRNTVHFDAQKLSDPILIREDGSMTYMISSVIDDIDYDVTHIVRGEDHITNTAISIMLIKALGGNIPKYAHLSLLKSKNSEISKRDGGFDVMSLRERGVLPMAINSLLGTVGTSNPIEMFQKLEDMIHDFDFSKFGKAPAIYDLDDLVRMNRKYLARASFDDVKDNFKDLDIMIDKDFWDLVRCNINYLSDVKEWWNICHTKISPIIDEIDKDYLEKASDLLPMGKLNENSYGEWTKDIKEKLGRSGKELFLPLRKAITAAESGPELKFLLPILGYEKIKDRLCGNPA